jgi:hypothetical protein
MVGHYKGDGNGGELLYFMIAFAALIIYSVAAIVLAIIVKTTEIMFFFNVNLILNLDDFHNLRYILSTAVRKSELVMPQIGT